MAKKPAGMGRVAPPGRPDGSVSRLYRVKSKPSSLIDTRVIWCGDCLEQLQKLRDAYVDLIYIDPPFNSNRNCEGRGLAMYFCSKIVRPQRVQSVSRNRISKCFLNSGTPLTLNATNCFAVALCWNAITMRQHS